MSLPSNTLAAVAAALLITTLTCSFTVQAYAQSDEHMTSDQSHLPTANIGNRQLALDFTTSPATALPAQPIDINLSLIDKNTDKNVSHVSYTVIITNGEGKQVFSEVVHGHEGKVNMRFINDASLETYRVSANYDNLAASYVSDFGSPIKVQGQVFSTSGDYKVAVEVTGIDFDNTFLPEPLKYSFVLPITPKHTLTVSYQNSAFDVSAYSSMTISKAELITENKQLILTSVPANDSSTQSGNFTIRLEIPKQMMSGPFSASTGNGVTLGVKEDLAVRSDQFTTVVLSGKHDDISQSGSPASRSIIITAANVVPEFPVGLVGSIAAIGFAAIIIYIRTLKADGKLHF
jgi:hypothetical protein